MIKIISLSLIFGKSRGIKIIRKGFEVKNKKKAKKKKTKKGQNKEVKISPPEIVVPAATAREELTRQGKLTEEQYVTEIAKSVPVSNLGGWYQALVAILGQEKRAQLVSENQGRFGIEGRTFKILHRG